MLRYQFIASCGKELALFLIERIPAAIVTMAKLADQYAEARSSTLILKPKFISDPSAGADKGHVSFQRPQSFIHKDKARSDRKCYECGKPGHLSFECPDKKRSPQRAHALTDFTQQKSVRFAEEGQTRIP